ncbi:polymerase [Vibrio phage vB_VpaM_sm033]|nr:polymerase [Vibrio phage vB_VpaM_sm033]
MIDPAIVQGVKNMAPRWNEKVCHGMAIEEFPKIPEVIHLAMKQAFKGFGDFQYVDYKLADPKEAYAEITRPRSNKNTYEQAKTTAALYRYEFMFGRERMRWRYQFLPHLDADGLLKIKDSRYQVAPTLSDQFFSIEEGKVFIPIPRAPVTIYREDYYFHKDGIFTPVDVLCSRLHFTSKDEAPPSRHPQLMNYFFCLWGATQAFRYMGMEVAIMDEGAYSEEDFPSDEWVKCTSTGKRPKMRIPNFTTPDTVLMVKREHLTRVNESFIASFFYVVDNCSDLSFLRPEVMDEPTVWKRALARFIWRNPNVLDCVDNIDAHIASLEEYLDETVIRKLRVGMIPAETIWDLFRYVLVNYQDMVLNSNPANILGKELRIIEPIVQDTIIMINRLMFAIRGLDPAKFRKDTIEELFNRGFTQNMVIRLASDHPEISLVDCANDQKTFKISSLVHRPSKNNGSASASDMRNPMYWLDPNMLDAFSRRMVTKSSPTASNRIRPAIKLGPNNEVLPDPDMERFREEFARLK